MLASEDVTIDSGNIRLGEERWEGDGDRRFDGSYGEPTDDAIADMKARGQHPIVLPGGTREALRPFWRRLVGHGSVPAWLGIGMGGLWPFALPWPTRIVQQIGPRIDVRALGGLEDALAHMTSLLQSMLDSVRR
jgi:hypothetical protein